MSDRYRRAPCLLRARAWQASPPSSIPDLPSCVTDDEKAVLVNLLNAWRRAFKKWSDASEGKGEDEALNPAAAALIFAFGAYDSASSLLQNKLCPSKATAVPRATQTLNSSASTTVRAMK